MLERLGEHYSELTNIADFHKSQELFRVLGLQSSKGVNNLSFDSIIQQSCSVVKTFCQYTTEL